MRKLLDRKDTMVTEDDKHQEEEKIKKAISQCGYSKLAMEKVKQQMKDKIKVKGKKKETEKEKSKGMLVIPYVQGVLERLQRVYKKYNINVPMRPHNTFL